MVLFPATLYKIQNRHNEHNAGTLSNRNYCCISVRGHWVHIDLPKDWDRGLGRGLGRDLVLWRTTHAHIQNTKYNKNQRNTRSVIQFGVYQEPYNPLYNSITCRQRLFFFFFFLPFILGIYLALIHLKTKYLWIGRTTQHHRHRI
jgi:hypothetical protein